MAIRVLIADAEEIVRMGLRAILTQDEGFEVVADTGDGGAVLELALRTSPDVCVLATSLAGTDGLEVVRRTAGAPWRTVVLTRSTSADDFCEAMSNGAHGFLAKELAPAVLRQGIRLAACGAYALSAPAVDTLRTVLNTAGHTTTLATRGTAATPLQPLSPGELHVAALVADGRTDQEIAEVRGVSVSAVKKTVAHCRHKVLAGNRVELARWAWLSGIGTGPASEPRS
ncbi:response regulator transcription factor [Streptomyces sp. NBC_00347]|uniref:response regulator n=1 Tax=Streptomyces sp. NBC_00347 TaxID=2975721 RepID=UPI00225C1FFA|nr:response regulator transcription factor [Streptomyces sp. NBC_00347]MCX5127000.1 response regulator transcription factor [Streptomyces sp. NBC_00347]